MTRLDRPKLVACLSRHLLQKSCPRLHMALIIGATGLAGFLASVLFLNLGLERMWLRYPLAVACSYGTFLLLVKLWIIYQTRSLKDDVLDTMDPDLADLVPRGHRVGVSHEPRASSDVSCSDLLSGLDGDEWFALIAIVIAVVVGVFASIMIIFSAPALLGEVLLDVVVVAGLRQRLINVAQQHWTLGVVRRTILPCLLVALCFSLAGAVMQHARPEAVSIGGIFHAESNR